MLLICAQTLDLLSFGRKQIVIPSFFNIFLSFFALDFSAKTLVIAIILVFLCLSNHTAKDGHCNHYQGLNLCYQNLFPTTLQKMGIVTCLGVYSFRFILTFQPHCKRWAL